MTVLCLTGWQQPADALAAIAPGATCFDYSAYDDVRAMFASLPPAPKLAVGWSLGGQLLVRAVAAGVIRPGAILLLGAPFQWRNDSHFPGLPGTAVAEVKRNYARDPGAMLKSFNALVALGDTEEKAVLRRLNASSRVWKNGRFWLDELARVSCRDMDFSAFPPTVVVHGGKDKVIYPANAQAFKERLPEAELLLWPGCAHAPHLHDQDEVRRIASRHV